MKIKRAGVLWFVLLAIFLWPSEGLGEKSYLRVIEKGATVRLKPDPTSMVISAVSLGTVLEAEEKTGEWFRVSLPPDEKGFVAVGYIHSSSVEIMTERAVERKPVIPQIEPPVAHPPKRRPLLGIKITGGMNYLLLGDLNDMRAADNGWYKDYAGVFNGSLKGEWESFHFGLDFEGDILYFLSSRLGISIGTGYVYGKKGRESSKITINFPAWSQTTTRTLDTEVSALPVNLGVYYFFPLSSRIQVFLNAGAGYYFARYVDEYRQEVQQPTGNIWYNDQNEANSQSIGFHGGIGFEYGLARNIALIIEGYGRYAKISGFEGDYVYTSSPYPKYSQSGTLYFYERFQPSTNSWYTWIGVREEKPTGYPSFPVRNVREAYVDFSGFAIKAGIRFSF